MYKTETVDFGIQTEEKATKEGWCQTDIKLEEAETFFRAHKTQQKTPQKYSYTSRTEKEERIGDGDIRVNKTIIVERTTTSIDKEMKYGHQLLVTDETDTDDEE